MEKEITIFDIAKYILKKYGEMSTLKLQKLCYYIQAWYMVWFDRPIFKEDFEAWTNGPVCSELFRVHKGMYNINESKLLYGNPDILNIYERNFIDFVLDKYASMSSDDLTELSHNEAPWKAARQNLESNSPSHNVISKVDIKEYYRRMQLIGEKNQS